MGLLETLRAAGDRAREPRLLLPARARDLAGGARHRRGVPVAAALDPPRRPPARAARRVRRAHGRGAAASRSPARRGRRRRRRRTATFVDVATGASAAVAADAVVAADGIHSVARAQRYPDEGPPKWNGSLLWRGVAEIEPVLDGRTMVWAGHRDQKFVGYPIADLADGRQAFNFIAELRRPGVRSRGGTRTGTGPACSTTSSPRSRTGRSTGSTSRRSSARHRARSCSRWSTATRSHVGRSAAHAARRRRAPDVSDRLQRRVTGDPRRAGARRLLRADADDVGDALARYEQIRLPATAAIVEANRGLGPEMPMQLVHERAPDGFDDIGDGHHPSRDRRRHRAYRRTAGFALEALLEDPRSIIDRPPEGDAAVDGVLYSQRVPHETSGTSSD